MAFGVYVHVPFCARRCDYCAFAAWDDRHDLTGRYLAALRRQAAAEAVGCPPVTSVFVGGGTPSMVPAEGLLAVLAELPLADGAEVTVECNPDTVTPELVEAYVAGGVNRLSFGVQSMVPHVLASLGREHDPANVRRVRRAGRGPSGSTRSTWTSSTARRGSPSRTGATPSRRSWPSTRPTCRRTA